MELQVRHALMGSSILVILGCATANLIGTRPAQDAEPACPQDITTSCDASAPGNCWCATTDAGIAEWTCSP